MGHTREPLQFTRRDFGKLALAGLPLSLAFADVNSKFKGVQIGAITYSFRTMPNPEDIIKAYVTIGLGSVGDLLVVIYTYRDSEPRLISARHATRRERNAYES